jgi:tRNA 5-methylaminomethyl-2-thiouridine biosynthesis bifunctional protein
MVVSLANARIEKTAQGTPYSPQFHDVYHSEHGGLAQARHVFLGGNALPQRWQRRDSFTILETGFGLGLSFLAAWQAWRGDPLRAKRLHFVSVEHSPLCAEDLAQTLAPFTELEPLARALTTAWPPPLKGFQRLQFDGGQVTLSLLLGDARTLLPQLIARVDAFFLDGFTPAKNPQVWSPEVVRELARLAAPGATLATWTVAGGVRTALVDAGFRIEKRAGFAPKREMLAGTFQSKGSESPASRLRRAIVVGAGLAGTLAAERLASREWSVELLDSREQRSNPAVGLLRPIANLRDGINAQVSRSAFVYALQHYRAMQHDGYHLQWERCGVLQLAGDADEAARMEAIASSQGYPASLIEFVDGTRAQAIAGRAVRGPGWWMPSGATVSFESLAIASLARAGERVHRHFGARVERVEQEDGMWRAFDGDGVTIAEAPVLIVANAADAKRLLPGVRLTLSPVRGQVTYLPASPLRALDVVVSGSGYVAPLPGGGHCVGASYHHDDSDTEVRAADHRENLARAESMLPGFTADLDPAKLGGWTGYRATVPDRLPIFGETSFEGLYAATGLGSRGLLWAPLGAELLASALEDEPIPLPRDLAGAISPRRFLS